MQACVSTADSSKVDTARTHVLHNPLAGITAKAASTTKPLRVALPFWSFLIDAHTTTRSRGAPAPLRRFYTYTTHLPANVPVGPPPKGPQAPNTSRNITHSRPRKLRSHPDTALPSSRAACAATQVHSCQPRRPSRGYRGSENTSFRSFSLSMVLAPMSR